MHGLQQSSLAMNAKLRPCSIKHVFRSGKRTQRLPHAASSKVTASSTFPNRRDMLTVTGNNATECRRNSADHETFVSSVICSSFLCSSCLMCQWHEQADNPNKVFRNYSGGGVLLAGLQAMAPPAGYCDGLEKKTVAVQYLSALQKNAQRKAFRVGEHHARDINRPVYINLTGSSVTSF